VPHIAQPVSELYDIAVIGGGINGVGIAADAAGRGLSVFLCERDDLASHTSSASSKLIHGGLRYLEHYEFRLVREALAEREVLLAKAPHIVKPMRFVLPHRPHLRPAWMIRAGLFLYDHLGMRKKLPASQGLRFGSESPLKPAITRGFEYSVCSSYSPSPSASRSRVTRSPLSTEVVPRALITSAITSLGLSLGALPPRPSATRMSPLGSTSVWRGIFRSVAIAVTLKPSGTVGS